jgi:hypothetical protein
MKQAVLITGFNNWGKTWTIEHIFNRHRFWQYWTYAPANPSLTTRFTVEPHSNDDFHGQDWVNAVQQRIDNSPDGGQNLFSALCPSMEPTNNFINLLSQPTFTNYNIIHLFLLEFKWEHHARLILPDVLSQAATLPNINTIVINADARHTTMANRWTAKINQVMNELSLLFP